MFIHLNIVCDCFCDTEKAELSKDNQKYLLSDPIQKKFADPCLRPSLFLVIATIS